MLSSPEMNATNSAPLAKKRGVPNVRWLARARLDAQIPPQNAAVE
jgi:hypothetical protein